MSRCGLSQAGHVAAICRAHRPFCWAFPGRVRWRGRGGKGSQAIFYVVEQLRSYQHFPPCLICDYWAFTCAHWLCVCIKIYGRIIRTSQEYLAEMMVKGGGIGGCPNIPIHWSQNSSWEVSGLMNFLLKKGRKKKRKNVLTYFKHSNAAF